jgi:hypothetical protein
MGGMTTRFCFKSFEIARAKIVHNYPSGRPVVFKNKPLKRGVNTRNKFANQWLSDDKNVAKDRLRCRTLKQMSRQTHIASETMDYGEQDGGNRSGCNKGVTKKKSPTMRTRKVRSE